MSIFPNSIDSDLELPLIENNVTQINAESINNLRDAILAIEKTLGTNLQGNKTTLADRLNVSLDADGLIKSQALQGIGLVGLPIFDAEIAEDAAIQESKLALNFSTASLHVAIVSAQADVSSALISLDTVNDNLNQHILGQAFFHDGYDIDVNRSNVGPGLAGLSGVTTIGDAVNILDGYLLGGISSITPHLDFGLPFGMKHNANTLFVNTSSFANIMDANASNVQAALNEIDASSGILGIRHVETFHSPGIFNEAVAADAYNTQQELVTQSAISYVGGVDGYGIVSFPFSLATFDIDPGDILVINSGVLDSGTYQIRVVGPLNNPDILGDLPSLDAYQLAVFHIFQETNDAYAEVFQSAFISTDASPLACAVRPNESIVDTISVLHPHAARVKSLGFDGTIIAADGYSLGIQVGVGGGLFRSITVPNLQLDRLSLSQANPVDSKSVAERINAILADTVDGYHFPATAYRVGDELVIAHNWVGPQYTIEILDGYSGNFALGFDAYGSNVVGQVVSGNIGNYYSVNGKSLGEISIFFDGYANISAPNASTFALYSVVGQLINPLEFGIVQGSVLQISGHFDAYANGSYTVLTSTSTSVSIFPSESIPGPATVTVLISMADVALASLRNSMPSPFTGLMQVYIDSNQNVLLHQRLIYGEIHTYGSSLEITNVSASFPLGDTTIVANVTGSSINFNLIANTLSGDTVTISTSFVGNFKLYHPNNLDFVIIDFNSARGPFIGGTDTITVSAQLPEDEALLLCTSYFNGELEVTTVVDNRLFGNIGVDKVRDDLVEFIAQRPVEELRTDGVSRGFDVAEAEFLDSVTGMVALPLTGGVAYVEGVRVATLTQKVILRSFDSLGNPITANKIVGINEFGTIQEVDYDLGSLLEDGYETVFGRILPLYSVSLVSGSFDGYTDIRRFINTLDNKVELVVDGTQNNFIGTFTTLEGALLYAQNYPSSEKMVIKLVGSVYPAVPIVIPQDVSIIGSSLYGGTLQQIVNQGISNTAFITLSGNNRLENIGIVGLQSSVDGYLVQVAGSNVNIEKCSLGFQTTIGSNSGDVAIDITTSVESNVRIVNNIINTVYSGIIADTTVQNLFIDNNQINVSGNGTLSVPACGVAMYLNSDTAANIVISNNNIQTPTFVSSTADLRGIYAQIIDSTVVDVVKIYNNNISGTDMSNGIRVDVLDSVDGYIDVLFVNNNTINGIDFDDNNVYGIGIKCESNSSHTSVIVNRAMIFDNVLTNIGDGYTSNVGIYVSDGGLVANVSQNIIENSNLSQGIVVAPNASPSSGQATVLGNTLASIGNAVCIFGTIPGSIVKENILNGSGNISVQWSGANSILSENNITGTGTSTGILFSGSGDSITGNVFNGSMSYAINSSATLNNVTINSNSASMVLSTNSVFFPNATSSCLLVGNNFFGSTSNVNVSAVKSANIGV